jgi:hypothetical protein
VHFICIIKRNYAASRNLLGYLICWSTIICPLSCVCMPMNREMPMNFRKNIKKWSSSLIIAAVLYFYLDSMTWRAKNPKNRVTAWPGWTDVKRYTANFLGWSRNFSKPIIRKILVITTACLKRFSTDRIVIISD